jgi:hypothetical protein
VALGRENGLVLLINGKADGSLIVDRGTQAMGALLPAAAAPGAAAASSCSASAPG